MLHRLLSSTLKIDDISTYNWTRYDPTKTIRKLFYCQNYTCLKFLLKNILSLWMDNSLYAIGSSQQI